MVEEKDGLSGQMKALKEQLQQSQKELTGLFYLYNRSLMIGLFYLSNRSLLTLMRMPQTRGANTP
jgi:hypothetical protein